MTFQLPDGSARSVPISWTDAAPGDPYLCVGGGRSQFRVEDLLALAKLIAALLVVCQLNDVHSVKLIMSLLLIGTQYDRGGFTGEHVYLLAKTIAEHF